MATEDASFYTNPGVDLKGIVRAVWIDLQGGDVLAGGSTITQQVARTLLLSPEERAQRTLIRKLREAILAWRLTRASRYTPFESIPPQRASLEEPLALDYEPMAHPERTEPDSDIYALRVDRVVSVAPLSLDLTSRTPFGEIEALLCGPAPL